MLRLSRVIEVDFVEQEVNEEDEKVFQMFMSKDFFVRWILVDIIMEKIIEKQIEIRIQMLGECYRVS